MYSYIYAEPNLVPGRHWRLLATVAHRFAVHHAAHLRRLLLGKVGRGRGPA